MDSLRLLTVIEVPIFQTPSPVLKAVCEIIPACNSTLSVSLTHDTLAISGVSTYNAYPMTTQVYALIEILTAFYRNAANQAEVSILDAMTRAARRQMFPLPTHDPFPTPPSHRPPLRKPWDDAA